MKNRRLKTDIEEKMCKKCKLEYVEKENYNWSCRTHSSTYGDYMWWCCGKTSKEALGCIYSKHVCKDDDEEEVEEGDLEDNVKCVSCKEKGHTSTECPKDPNFR